MYQLPRIVQQLNTKVTVISDLLNMFTQQHNSNIDLDEAISLIREIIDSIKKTVENNTLVVVSFQKQQQHNSNKLYGAAYDKILLPRFDKRIEITTNNNSSKNDSKINSLLGIKIYNKHSKHYSRSLLLEERELLQADNS